jgi:outer membrane protein OmpA-like peptidoglycan-associated protein
MRSSLTSPLARPLQLRSPFVRSALALALLVAMGSPARAQNKAGFALNNFQPAINLQNFYVTEDTRLLPHLGLSLGMMLDYAHRPLRLQLDDGATERDLVGYHVNMNFLFGLGLFDRIEIGLLLPVTIAQGTGSLSSLGSMASSLSGGAGDLRFIPKGRIWTWSFFTLGAALPFTLPSGSRDDLLGDGYVGFTPELIGGFDFGRLGAAINLGYRIRKDRSFYAPGGQQQVAIDDQIVMSLAGRYNVWRELDVLADLYWAVGVKEQDIEEVPVELLMGAHYRFKHDIVATAGLGFGLTAGVGTPVVRVLAGAAWQPRWTKPAPPPPPAEDPDPDRDGILGKADACPYDPEDKDGFEDTDGCPDADNDKDGICDPWVESDKSGKYAGVCQGSDKCPNEAEDKDSFEDTDGCPDPDNDKDGIPDVKDRCPNDPEDKDSFEDADGCPDPDNDKDGICDPWVEKSGQSAKYASICKGSDKCPNEPEVFNGFEDEDGCPDSSGNINISKGKITAPPVFFATAKDVVLKRSLPMLRNMADLLLKNPWVKKVRVEGHTDDRGKDAFNLDLSQRRARSVMQALVDAGVPADRLESEGFGKTRPILSNKTPRGRAENRRVEFVIIDPPIAPASAPTTP